MKLDLKSILHKSPGSTVQKRLEKTTSKKTIFQERNGLKDRLVDGPGKMGVADGGYEIEDMGFLCIPNSLDSKERKNFKSSKASLSS
jgi:hypothetical protein